MKAKSAKKAAKGAPKGVKDAIQAINRRGCLLAFPIDNRKEFPSIWSEFYPKSPMRWEWDEDGDNRVARLWHLRAELSTSNRVIYTKWFRGRATFFSRPVFVAMRAILGPSWAFRPQRARSWPRSRWTRRSRPRLSSAPPIFRAVSTKEPTSARFASSGRAC